MENQPKSAPMPAQPPENSVPECDFEDFLQDAPLHSKWKISEFFGGQYGDAAYPRFIRVHCDNPRCDGVRRHDKHKDGTFWFSRILVYHYVSYLCTDCQRQVKIFGIMATRKTEQDQTAICTKIYQEPAFGQPIPKRLFHVIGETNREYFLQARRAIARGLGIGAYGYYRRIVENTKFDLVGSVLEVAQATNASPAQVELLKKAQAEKQFSKAIDILRDVSAIPAALLIDGHNPLALLHDALSEGIHELSDAECLERAQEAEIILCEIANRMQIAVTEQKTVKAALASVLKRKSAGGKGPPNE